MARSKFIWLVVFEDGETQWINAQTTYQIINCDSLLEDSDNIINITRLELASYAYEYKNVLDIPFED